MTIFSPPSDRINIMPIYSKTKCKKQPLRCKTAPSYAPQQET